MQPQGSDAPDWYPAPLEGSLWSDGHAMQGPRRHFDVVVNVYGSAPGLRVTMHVRGKESTNSWSLSVHAITLQLVYH